MQPHFKINIFFLGEKPYKCTYCTFSSASATNLKTHMKNHTNKLQVETAHNGIIQMEDNNVVVDDNVENPAENPNEPNLQDTTVIQYIFQENEEDDQGTEQPQYTIISEYEHAQTVIEDTKTRILSTTQNEDGITLMVTTDGTGNTEEIENHQNSDNQNIVYYEIPIEENEETVNT